MRKLIVATTVSLLAASGLTFAQAPQAAPEHKRLNYFAGTWNFTGKTEASPWGPGGAISFKEVCELMEGGFALVCRSEGKSPMGATRSVSIMSYDMEKKAYTYTAAESKSPVFTAMGQTNGPAWNWTTEAKMDGKTMTTKVVIKESGQDAYEMTMELSTDGSAFKPVMHGKATRVAATS